SGKRAAPLVSAAPATWEEAMQASGPATAEFETGLRRDGYQGVSRVEMKPGQHNPDHAHDFDAKALILAGDITITCGEEVRCYRAGDVVPLAAGPPQRAQIRRDG